MVVKSTASTVLPKCQSYNSFKLNILIGLLLNMFIVKSKQISCSQFTHMMATVKLEDGTIYPKLQAPTCTNISPVFELVESNTTAMTSFLIPQCMSISLTTSASANPVPSFVSGTPNNFLACSAYIPGCTHKPYSFGDRPSQFTVNLSGL